MKNIPKRIYLQVDSDGEPVKDFNELSGVTWCVDPIHYTDLVYISRDEIQRLISIMKKKGFYEEYIVEEIEKLLA